jgi:adenine-specific DNA-methyltransferase
MSQNCEKLKSLLAELFQLDHAELDFGIYRIMNARRKEIERFLKDDLCPQVVKILSNYTSDYTYESLSALKADLERAKEQAKALDLEDPAQAPKVEKLQELYNFIKEAESQVFSHLYNFFRRYYSEGDFISQRRYKEGVYAIPYEGEEVKLYWANYDQYYIKTTEYFRDYTFKVSNGKRVHFKLVEADTEKDNNRSQNGKERRFILSEKQPLAVENGELVIRFEYRPDPEKRKQADLNAEAVDRILNKIKELKEQPPEEFKKLPQKELEKWQRELDSLRQELSSPRPTEKNPNRTLLEKHLADYTARNTFDYFIHKDLGGFLRRELDFYIKNEVVHLDDIENETAPRVKQYLAKVKAIRRIAHKIIDFLEQLENFQKKLWLKKKFVVETRYCVTLDRIFAIKDEETRAWLVDQILKSDAQREEWVRLFAIDEIQGDHMKPGYSEPLTAEFIEANPHLVLDTRHFSEDFKRRLLASFDDLDEQCDGLLIHSENFQALNLLSERYRGQVKCVYIDPPYNTDQDRQTGKFLYKNAYEHSTWLTMMTNRLSLDAQLLHQEGAHFVSTDENELHWLVSIIMGYGRKYHGLFTWRRTRTGGHLSSAFNQLSDYVVVSTNPSGNQLFGGQADPDESQPLVKASNLRKELRFPAGSIEFLDKQSGIIPAGTKGTGANPVSCLTHIEIVNGRNVSEVVLSGPFVWTQQRLESELAAGARIVIKRAVSLNPRFYRVPRGHKPFPSLADDHFPVGTNEDGSEELESILGPGHGFTYPKPVLLIQRIVQSKSFFDKNLTVLDYFAGSGTTAHAVINLNREDGGRRKYILVEMGEYFDTILVPRIKKVVYSKDWKDGKPVSREGISHMFKYIRLESYEDTLNNLKLERTEQQNKVLFPKDPKEYSERKSFREDYILHYMLDVESRGSPSLLDLDRFEDPFNYKLNIATGTAGETKPTAVDLVETFNYLIGLRVKTIRYLDGVCVVTGTNPQGERVLILWRNAKEIDNDKLDDWFQKQGYNAKDQEFDAIYVNGDNNLENLKGPNHTWKVRLIEEEFLRRMFDVQDV